MKKITLITTLLLLFALNVVYGQITTYPYNQDFEAFSICGTFAGAACTLSEGWTNVLTDDVDWTTDLNGTGSNPTGPTANGGADHNPGVAGGKYLYVETSTNGTGYPNSNAILESPIFDLTVLPNAQLTFWYHMFGGSMGNLFVEVTTDGGTTYTTILAPFTDNQDVWQEAIIDLSAYAAFSAVQFRFNYTSGTSFQGDVAIDDVTVEIAPIPAIFADCPMDADIPLMIGQNTVTYTFADPTATDPEGGSVTVTQTAGLPSGSAFPPGSNRIEFTATNDASPFETTICEFFVNVTIATFLYEESFESGDGGWASAGANNSWQLGTPAGATIIGASDGTEAWATNLTGNYPNNENSAVSSPLFDFSNSTNDPSINLDVWWNSENSWDGTVLQSSTDSGATWQNVGDFNDPENWYNDNTINGNPGGQQIGWTGREATNNGSGEWVEASHILTGFAGETSVALRVAFGSDGSVTDDGFAFDNVVIYYPGDPVFSDCPTDITETIDPGACEKIVTFATPMATDSEAEFPSTVTVVQTQGPASGSGFPFGTTLIEFTATNDNSPNETVVCQFNVIVNGTITPVITCPANMTVDVDTDCMFELPDYTTLATTGGFCAAPPTITQSPAIGTMVGAGITTITLTADDGLGQVAACDFDINVEDNIPPTIACPEDIMAFNEPGMCNALVFFGDPIALDNCGTVSVVQTDGLPSGSEFPVGVSTIEYTATDDNGNTSVCTFDITVVDNELPMTVCQDITIDLDELGVATIVAADLDGGSTDNCGIDNIAISMDTFDCSNVGTNDVILTVTDVNGNMNTCVAVVTVQDITLPVVACMNITVELDADGMAVIAGTDVDGGSSDACGIASYDLDIDTFDCSNVGDNEVILTVTDANGNSDSCTAIVTVEDNIAPTVVCSTIDISLDENGMAIITADDISDISDNCGIATTAIDISEFDCSDIGTPITVQVFATDDSGNVTTCMSIVNIIDDMGPELTCPEDQAVATDPTTQTYTFPDYFATGEAVAGNDNCTADEDIVTTQDPAPGTMVGISAGNVVTLTATDENGNTTTCTFTVDVQVLGVEENSISISSLILYPNPATEYVILSNPNSIELKDAAIYDLNGRLVKTIPLEGMGIEKTVNISELQSATYMFVIQGQGQTISKQFIKE